MMNDKVFTGEVSITDVYPLNLPGHIKEVLVHL